MTQRQQVFISYARDGGISERVAAELHEQLIRADIAVFRDVEGIDPGSHWAMEIEKQIVASRLMVVVVSEAALDPQRWVHRECLFASNRRIPIIPVLVQSVELPLWLTHVQALDFTQSQPWGRLLLAVGKYVEAVPKIDTVISVQQGFQVPSPPVNKPLHSPATAVSQIVYSPELQQLLAELQTPAVKAPRRLEIGNRLNILGDPRLGLGVDVKSGLPDIDWINVPAGVFTFQRGERLHLDEFCISRYPVTNRQFQAFIADRGYDTDEWWEGLQKPDTAHEPYWKEGNRPVEQVDWYEAMAFCRWLSSRMKLDIRLPTEEQWEKASRGTDGREYPWGNGYKTGYANIDETGREDGIYYLEETSAVGIYPHGQSPYGLMDMAGNVWEWCLNKWDDPKMVTADLSGSGRVVRGGSWGLNSEHCRSSSRLPGHPFVRYFDRGFRLVCCLRSHSSH